MKKKLQILLVNLVTTVRMVGIFALLPIYMAYGGVALGLTNIACFLTDAIDGKLARKFKASTFFGSMYDGFSDKAFLAVNFAILTSITPVAIIPILLELGIVGVQGIKYKEGLNVKSNFIGKSKMWIAGICMILSNFLLDIDKLNFVGNGIISKLASLSDAEIVGATLIPVIVAEVATLLSYVKELKTEKEKDEINDIFEEIELEEQESISLDKDLELTESSNRSLEEIALEKENIQKQKEELKTLKEMLFSPEFYEEHKDEKGLKLLRTKFNKNK